MVESIPKILQYFVPGYIFICILRFFRSAKIGDTTIMVGSVVVSYLFAVLSQVLSNGKLDGWQLWLLQSALASCCALLFSWLSFNPYCNKLLRKIGHKSQHSNIWDDIVDYDIGTLLVVTLKGTDYKISGNLIEIEENGTESWFALSQYEFLDPMTYQTIQRAWNDNEQMFSDIVINLRDVQQVELYYRTETKIFK